VDLAYQWPEIDFLFDLTIGHVTVCTDAKEIDISNHIFENTDQVERYVNCFPNLQKVIMCECGISNEEMDALNRKYEDIRFVWSVQLGVKLFRTDSLYYTPNKWGEKCFDETIYNLRYCTDMVCVDIGHMKDVSNCEWAAFMPNLKYLILAQTAIRDLTPLSGLKNLVFLELFQSKARDYSPLVSITSLEDLNLSYTFGDPEPISQMTWLKRLWWSGSWIARTTLPEVLTETEMEFYQVSSTGGTWREGQNYYDMRDLIGMDYMSG
jgi:Leucine-rich repeat (LRR) protein